MRKYLHHHHHDQRLLFDSDIAIPLRNQTMNNTTSIGGGGGGGGGGKQLLIDNNNNNNSTNFDSNMMIILAALLCALICALGLNSIVRSVLRCTRRFRHENSDGRTRLGSKGGGVTKDVLRRIPVVEYESGMNVVKSESADCAICLTEFEQGERVRVLPECDHGFHVMCIDTWLRSHSSCPTCRQLLSHHSV